MKKIAVVLSGCGHRDGAEITEAISALIAIGQNGANHEIFAPNKDVSVTNPLTGESKSETRNILEESARIARGHIKDLSQLNEKSFDALVFPGGFGAALHLSDWALKGAKSQVLPEIEQIIKSFHSAGKPIAAICIAPTLIAKVLGSESVTITIGVDKDTASEIEKTGAQHENCAVTDFITDRAHKVVTTPAYMYDDAKPFEVFQGISLAIKELVEMA